MNLRSRARAELQSWFLAFLYFSMWFVLILVLKDLFLEEYDIKPQSITVAFLIALVVAKVVLLLDYLPLFEWLKNCIRAIEVAIRTIFYTVAALLALVAEKAFETRNEYGGFSSALVRIFDRQDINHVWAAVICVCVALLGYNVVAVVREEFPAPGLFNLFFRACRREIHPRAPDAPPAEHKDLRA